MRSTKNTESLVRPFQFSKQSQQDVMGDPDQYFHLRVFDNITNKTTHENGQHSSSLTEGHTAGTAKNCKVDFISTIKSKYKNTKWIPQKVCQQSGLEYFLKEIVAWCHDSKPSWSCRVRNHSSSPREVNLISKTLNWELGRWWHILQIQRNYYMQEELACTRKKESLPCIIKYAYAHTHTPHIIVSSSHDLITTLACLALRSTSVLQCSHSKVRVRWDVFGFHGLSWKYWHNVL